MSVSNVKKIIKILYRISHRITKQLCVSTVADNERLRDCVLKGI